MAAVGLGAAIITMQLDGGCREMARWLMLILTCKGPSTRGLEFAAELDGRELVEASTRPFIDACRVLLAEGADPEMSIVARHYGSAIDAMRGKVGLVAGMTPLEAAAWKHGREGAVERSRRGAEALAAYRRRSAD